MICFFLIVAFVVSIFPTRIGIKPCCGSNIVVNNCFLMLNNTKRGNVAKADIDMHVFLHSTFLPISKSRLCLITF